MYTLLVNGEVQRKTDGAYIPADQLNVDWRDYQAWLLAGNMPELEPPLLTPMPVLSPLQMRFGLIGAGVDPEGVDAAIASIPDATTRQQAAAYWHYTLTYHRDHPLIGQIGAMLGLSPAQIDAMWAAAATMG